MGVMGVGKTTFVDQLQRSVPLRYVSLGAITRSIIAQPGGENISELMQRGGVWPLKTIQDLVKPHLAMPTPYILDGVPRHPEEAEWLAAELEQSSYPTTALILRASRQEVRRRLQTRECLTRPETLEQIEDRVNVYDANYQSIKLILGQTLYRFVEIDTTALSPAGTVTELSRMVT